MTTLLSGCSQKVEANDTLPSTSASPTTETLPPVGPADFPVPDEARTKDPAGAEAFLRYFIELINRQQAIPDGQPLRDLGPNCQECLRIARAFDESAASGYEYVGGEISLNDVTAPQLNGDKADIAFGARSEAVSLRDSSGAPVPGGQAEAQPNVGSGIALTWSEGEDLWLVEGFNVG